MRYSELQSKDVVDVKNGQKVGVIVDLVILPNGSIESIVLEKTVWGKLYRVFGGKNSTIIPFSSITNIGADVIFVNIS